MPSTLPTSRRSSAAACAALLLAAGLPGALAGQEDAATAEDSVAVLTGQVVSAMTGGPLEGARVVLKGSGSGGFTDESGQFMIRNVPAGRDTVEVGLIGFATQQVPLTLKGGHVTRVTLMLSETVLRVEDITVEVEGEEEIGKLSGFYDRMKRGMGSYVTPEEIEERNAQHTSDYLRGVPGVQVGAYRMGRADVRVTRARLNCDPVYYLDGILNRSLHPDELNRDDILAIEVYRGPSETPPQFSFAGSGCGTIVIWTREGRDRRTGGR